VNLSLGLFLFIGYTTEKINFAGDGVGLSTSQRRAVTQQLAVEAVTTTITIKYSIKIQYCSISRLPLLKAKNFCFDPSYCALQGWIS
jgi:hypothetical protein